MTALGIEAVAVGLVVWRFRGEIVVRAGVMFVLAVALYSGVTEPATALLHSTNGYRIYILESDVQDWLILEAWALLAFAVAYCLVGRRRPAGIQVLSDGNQAVLDWRVLLVITVPFLVLAIVGRGLTYGGRDQAEIASTYWSTGLAAQFTMPLVVLTAAALVAHFGRRWLLPILFVQAMIAALPGERQDIAVSTILTLFVLRFYGIRLGRRLAVLFTLGLLVLGLAVAAARTVTGRGAFYYGSGPLERLEAIWDGSKDVNSYRSVAQRDLTSRIDTNSWGAMALAQMRQGHEPVGLASLQGATGLAVPAFLNQTKDEDVYNNEETYLDAHLGISWFIDWLPGQFAPWMVFFGPGMFPLVAAGAGVLFATADNWLRRPTFIRLLFGLFLVAAVAQFERGNDVYFLQLRGILVILTILLVVRRLFRSGTRLSGPKTVVGVRST